jgi:sulfatase modifying factor 1
VSETRTPPWLVLAMASTGCGRSAPADPAEAGVHPPAEAAAAVDASGPAPSAAVVEAGPASACPDDMVSVDTSYCPDVERRCVDMEHEEKNNLPICHAFAHESRCRTDERRIAFCIDRYEYPNRKGAHPTWMLDWNQAQATCESKGKRLCDASEWTAACEGPEKTPFPYGWERDHDKCNSDNFYIDPKKPGPHAQFFFYSKDPEVAFPELSRLDQSVPSGSMESCRSGFGVYDMPGNVDEWVVNDGPPREKAQWAALKGGAWGHVRSQCRPTTYSHEPEFYYYFVGFRCCRDADGAPPEAKWTPSRDAVPPPPIEAHDFATEPIVPIDPPGPSKTKYTRTGHRE